MGDAILERIAAAFPALAVTPCKYSGSPGNSGSSSELPADGPWHDAIKQPDDYERQFALAPVLLNR